MHCKLLITLVFGLCWNVLCSTNGNASWLKIQMNHSLNCASGIKFCHRGNIAIKNFTSGYFVIKQKNLTSEDLKQLRHLADVDGFYSIQTKVSTVNGSTIFLSSMKASDFLENGLRDRITIWLQLNGHPMAINFGRTNHKTPPTLIKLDNNDYKIVSVLSLRTPVLAPEPDIEPYKLKKEQDEQQKKEEEQSFIEKYWLYFVVIIFFFFASGAAGEEE